MYFLVNASPLKGLELATSMLWLAQKRVFAMVYHRLKSIFSLQIGPFEEDENISRKVIPPW